MIYKCDIYVIYVYVIYYICVCWQASAGVYSDESGPQMVKLMRAMSADPAWPLECVEVATALVADDPGMNHIYAYT